MVPLSWRDKSRQELMEGVGHMDQVAGIKLPHLFEWKMMGQGLYVLGVEPANISGMQGRAAARQSGDLPCLAPGEIRRYALEIEVVEGSG